VGNWDFGKSRIPGNRRQTFMMNKKKMEILYIATNSDLGGISKYLLEIIKNIGEDIEAHFLMGSEGYLSEELMKIGIKQEQLHFIPMTNNIFDISQHIKSNLKTLELIKRIKPDVIHCNATTGAIVGAFCGFLTRIPTIYTVHGWPFTDGISKNKQCFYKILEFIICAVFKKIICVSEYDRQIGIKTLPIYKNKMIAIHNGISDIPKDYKKNEFSKDELKIVMISRFCPQKDPYTLINAVAEANKEGCNIKLDLYGYGQELEKVKDCINSQNDSNIRYVGEISDVTPILKNYDVYALISNWEGLPIGIIEAMRAGLPILVSDVGGNAECIRENGYLVKRGNIEYCKIRLKQFWNNINRLPEMGKNSRNFYEEEFIVEKMVRNTLILFEE
jgi:glycosyltransferase involved in cell wall biosynthesis